MNPVVGDATKTLPDILKDICIANNVTAVIDIDESKVIVHNGIDEFPIKFRKLYVFAKCECIQVDLKKFTDDRIELRISIKEVKNESFQISISDPYMDYFLPNDFTFSGDYIEINPSENLLYTYSLKLTLVQDTVKDADCQEYSEELTFQECIGNYAEKVFNDKIECVPPWFTSDASKMCSNSFSRLAFSGAKDRTARGMVMLRFDLKWLRLEVFPS